MQIIESDLFELKSLQARFTSRAQTLRPSIARIGLALNVMSLATFGGDHPGPWIWMQRIMHQLLGNIRPIDIGGINEVYAQIVCAPQHSAYHRRVGRLAPAVWAGELRGAQPKPIHLQVATDP